MQHEFWKTESNGVLSTKVGGLKLVVHAPEKIGRLVRFQVLRQEAGGSSGTLVGSGSEDCVQAAMTAAERMASRYRELGTRQALPDAG